MTEFLKIVGLGVLAAVGYGIAHDQITARLCIEYFTIGHPPLIASTSPTLLALAWGVVATWWVGLLLGVTLALAARVGPRPKLAAQDLAPLVIRLLATMAGVALMAGVLGYALANSGAVELTGALAEAVPLPARNGFIADLWAHNASYLSGILGGVLVAFMAYRRRRLLAKGAA